MININDISYAHWQMRLDRTGGLAGSGMGEIVTTLADVEQSIGTVILTEKGSVPGQPEKCTRLAPWIDRRADHAIPNISREIWDGLKIWEPRIIVEAVRITMDDFSHWRFPIFWRLAADVTRTVRQTIIELPQWRRPGGLSAH